MITPVKSHKYHIMKIPKTGVFRDINDAVQFGNPNDGNPELKYFQFFPFSEIDLTCSSAVAAFCDP